ncbi:uncharacterized protein K460DRAFT_271682 [Cucurbitaria berberidis CBS 394.84]|uniref:DUF2423 domain-containing protein n=1 Tax=Cucurbitaria berberidis CBS 394.84 TaxID=1168544 RepID=A0A9P4LEJ5_9PLEO|nr:uncharacterized protein K460DRAFT_271682 [Cucurbitaria berberidis CBS 394.84]KAF1851149.1 hypothetical protein K460DRAFT_271682 [Cucurbitaria berberidis CBS 394.84]
MAKSARASSKKANRTKLRARVFGPVEKARAERLHAKLLETIAQSKPERTEMDTAEATATEATKEDDLPKGSSFLTASIPRSLCDPTNTKLDPAQESRELRNLCFYMGLCSDIVGFSQDGRLKFAFDPLPPTDMDVDGAASAAKKSSKKNKDKDQSRKQLRRRPQNKISFPSSRGKGALKPFTGSRVGKRRS